jgi:hypothetical protein
MCVGVGKGRRIPTESTLELSPADLATLPVTKQQKREQLWKYTTIPLSIRGALFPHALNDKDTYRDSEGWSDLRRFASGFLLRLRMESVQNGYFGLGLGLE